MRKLRFLKRSLHTASEEVSTDPAFRDRALRVLNAYWGHSAFRTNQLAIIERLVTGSDVLAILSTGGGKSLCYQLPAVMSGGITIVVSPLISLMEDQVVSLNARGIAAWSLSGEKTHSEIREILDMACRQRAALLYLAPERLASRRFLPSLGALQVTYLAIDEAHCISEWGHEFRPAYRIIPEAYSAMGRPPILAVTATATPRVRGDIASNLKLQNPGVVLGNIDRPGLVFSVLHGATKGHLLDQILRCVPGPAIVYAPTRRSVERWTSTLNRSGRRACAYHAGMTTGERTASQQAWQADEIRTIVATNAFGMGIDKPDVRSVTHVGLPLSLEGYYQEAGRAGRDGHKAYATLLYDDADLKRYYDRIRRFQDAPTVRYETHTSRRNLFGNRDRLPKERVRMRSVLTYARSVSCRRRRLLGHFGTYSFRDCGNCDICLGRHERFVPNPGVEAIARSILKGLEEGATLVDLSGDLSIPDYRIRQWIDWMSRHGYLALDDFPEMLPTLTRLGSEAFSRAPSDCPGPYRREPHTARVRR